MQENNCPQLTIRPSLLSLTYNESDNSVVMLELTCLFNSVQIFNLQGNVNKGKMNTKKYNQNIIPELSILGHHFHHVFIPEIPISEGKYLSQYSYISSSRRMI